MVETGRSKYARAVDFLEVVLQSSEQRHPGNARERVNAILDLAYYENPFSDLFVAEDAGSSSGSDVLKGVQDQ